MLNTVVKTAVGIMFVVFHLVFCGNGVRKEIVPIYTDDELIRLRKDFDSCEAILNQYDSYSLAMVDSILPLAEKVIGFPSRALTYGQSLRQAKHYSTCAFLYLAKDDLASAFNVLEKGIAFYKDSQYRDAYAQIATATASLFFNYAMYNQANLYADYAIEAALPLGDSALLSKAYMTKAWILDRMKKNAEDKQEAYRYVNLSRSHLPHNDPHLEFTIEVYAGNIYATDLDSAARSLQVLKRIGDKYSVMYAGMEGSSYIPYNIGRVYATLGDMDMAVRYFEEALGMVEQEPLIIRNEVYSGILRVYVDNDMDDRAIDIIPKWYSTTKYRYQMITERGMAYWNARFESERKNYQLQVAENIVFRSKVIHRIVTSVILVLVLLIFILVYRLIVYKKHIESLYEDYQRRHLRWDQAVNYHEHPGSSQDGRSTPASGEMQVSDVSLENASDDVLYEIYERVRNVMEKDKPYLDLNFTLTELAVMVYSNRSQLSAAINRHYGTNFPTMVSEYRVNYFIDMVGNKQNPKVDELWPKAGFTSRSSFYRQFLMITKLTPSQYFGQRVLYSSSSAGKKNNTESDR